MQSLKDVNKRVKEKYPHLEFITYKGARNNSMLTDTRCNHIWETRPEYVYSRGIGINCPFCNKTNFKITQEILEYRLKDYPEIKVVTNIKSSKERVDIEYHCGHLDNTILSDLFTKGIKSICRICTPQTYNNKSHEHFLQEVKEINPNLTVIDTYKKDNTYLEVSTTDCNHTWKILPHNFLAKQTLAKCPICEPKRTTDKASKGESGLRLWLSKYTNISKKFGILNGFDIDIMLDDYNIGIEYNGEYWHSEKHKDKNYHIFKTNLAKDKGIRLIHIFEHEWYNKQDIVKSRLLSILGHNYKIGARECTIAQIDSPKQFLDENHIQGYCVSKYNYGLFLKDTLVAVMTFSKPRFNTHYDFELLRYASLTGVNVVGGASKLLNRFIKDHNPDSIISYSDKRWSIGNVYDTIGFKYSHTSEPGYFYAKHSTIISRYQAQKHKLKDLFPKIYNENKTEKEIMAEAGFYRVYDCGNDAWLWNK